MFPILLVIGNCFKASGSILFSMSTIFLNKNRSFKTFSPYVGRVERAVMDSLKRSVNTNKQLLQRSVFSLLSDDDTTTGRGILYQIYCPLSGLRIKRLHPAQIHNLISLLHPLFNLHPHIVLVLL